MEKEALTLNQQTSSVWAHSLVRERATRGGSIW
jgi:hypothetical protein